jgi:creatinine amidohydrolase
MHSWRLDELNHAQVRDGDFEVAVLPLGCTEPHNLHLPYGMDTFESDAIGNRVCQAAQRAGAKVVLLPTIPYGTVSNQRECMLSINVQPSTLYAFITDIVASLETHGIRKILILNSHGGNELKPLLRELYGRPQRGDEHAAQLFLCNWFQMVGDVYDSIFDAPEDHAGEMETSIGLACFPELVARDEHGKLLADEGATARSRFDAVNRGWVSVTRPWHLLTTNTGSGNPHAASKEKGEKILAIIEERLAKFLVELSKSRIDDRFPFE